MRAKGLIFGRSAGELRERGRQLGAAWLERLHLSSLVRLPPDRDVPPPVPGSQSWPPAPPSQAEYRQFLARTGASAASDLETAANGIMAGRLSLLGFRDVPVGSSVDWHGDPVAGTTSPRLHWSRIAYLDPSVSGDHKVVWEVNRHQWFLTLGRAWRLTGDRRYAECFVRHLTSWMDDNPPKVGVNWASSLEVAYRAIAWLWAFRLFEGYPGLTPDLLARARKFLFLHGRHIETYLSTYFSPNTHLTGEALGLVYLSAAFPGWRCASRWWTTGMQILGDALAWHVRPDGVYFEQASYYHRYTADIYTHAYLLARRREPGLAESIGPKLEALLEHLMWLTRPDGTTPNVGDDDGGRLIVLDERPPADFRAALSTGAVLFSRRDFGFVAGATAEETFWLLGPAGVEARDAAVEPPKELSRAFEEGGYYVMRDGWEPAANWLFADFGVHGALNCGHAHADALSIQLAARGVTTLVDPGTYRYTTSRDERDAFRSSQVHNTVSVDGQSSSVPSGPFSWSHVASGRASEWVTQPRFDFLEGEHDGFQRLPDPVVHLRSILFIRGCYWVVRDRLVAGGRHQYVSRFQFAPGLTLRLTPCASPPPGTAESWRGGNAVGARAESAGDPVLHLFSSGAAGRWEAAPGRVSPAYGIALDAPAAHFVVEGDGTTEWLTLLVPGGGLGVSANATAAGGFEVTGPGWIDRLLRGASRTVERRESRAEGGATEPGPSGPWQGVYDWMWLRENDTAATTDLVVFGLRSMTLEKAVTLEADDAIGWLNLRLSPGALELSFRPGQTLRLLALAPLGTLLVNGKATSCEAGQSLVLAG